METLSEVVWTECGVKFLMDLVLYAQLVIDGCIFERDFFKHCVSLSDCGLECKPAVTVAFDGDWLVSIRSGFGEVDGTDGVVDVPMEGKSPEEGELFGEGFRLRSGEPAVTVLDDRDIVIESVWSGESLGRIEGRTSGLMDLAGVQRMCEIVCLLLDEFRFHGMSLTG